MATITSTIGTTARDYSTIQAWEDAKDGDLVTAETIQRGVCYADSDFDELVTISGSTTNASYYMHLTVASGEVHDGTAFGGGVVIDRDGKDGYAVSILDSYTRLERLRIANITSSVTPAVGIRVSSGNLSQIKNCIIHKLRSAVTTKSITGIHNVSSTNTNVTNCLIYDLAYTGAVAGRTVIGIYATADGSEIYNCVVSRLSGGNSTSGINGMFVPGAGSTVFKNCISVVIFGGGSDNSFTANCDGDYNLSDDNTAPGANSLINKVGADQVVSDTAGSENYHLKAGADALTTGVGPSADADVPVKDIDFGNRSGATCDMGVDEYLVVAPAASITSLDVITGDVAGGTTVVITGTNFEAAQGTGFVTFDGTVATISAWADTEITLTTPAHAVGAVDVIVMNDSSASDTDAGGFTYTAAATGGGGAQGTPYLVTRRRNLIDDDEWMEEEQFRGGFTL